VRNWTWVRVALVGLFLALGQATWTLAGTTGSISGVATDQNGNPLADVSITVMSASQTAHNVTNSHGFYSILDLSPDTYTVTATKDGYDTSSESGFTVQADQSTTANVSLKPTVKTLGRIVTTAQASVVNKSVTGDLYSVNSTAISNYQGAVGGSESMYSQNAIVGSMPGVVHQIGVGGGYQQGQGTISLRGGAFDQVGFELEGIPLNRGFDFYNGTPFVSNGLSSLEVYTGGAPADSGGAMSGFINEVVQRGSYPGFANFNLTLGSPTLNNTYQLQWADGTPNNKFTWFISSLGMYATNNFGDRSNGDNYAFTVPANDPGCNDFNFIQNSTGLGGPTLTCTVPNKLNAPISVGAWLPQGSPINPSDRVWDTITNIHYAIDHNNLSDDLQVLYDVGGSYNPFAYSGASIDSLIPGFSEVNAVNGLGQITWPTGFTYGGAMQTAYNPSQLSSLFWPGSGNSSGLISPSYVDDQWTQNSLEKLQYTRELTSSSFLRVYGYASYSAWLLDQATNGVLGGEFYQLHDNATGLHATYQNQLNEKHLLHIDADYLKDLTLRYNYVNWLAFNQTGSLLKSISTGSAPGNFGNFTDCVIGPGFGPCTTAGQEIVDASAPYAYWSSTTPSRTAFSIADSFRPSDQWLFDLGLRFDNFRYALMPLQLTGPTGMAELAQSQNDQCLFGYAYTSAELCSKILTALATQLAATGTPTAIANSVLPGAAKWTDVSGSLTFNEFSPRLGITFTPGRSDVFRASVGRYVQPPDSAFEEYRGAPQFGAYATVGVLNRSYLAAGIAPSFLAVHNVQPEDSINYDFSWEHDFTNGWSAKATPFYRTTLGQILNLPVTLTSPTFVTGFNFGDARITGLEFLLNKNRINPELGWSGNIAATYTNSKIRFTPVNGQSYISVVNNAIMAYNSAHTTNFALEDPNGYYSPSFSIAPTLSTPSWDVPWVINVQADYKWMGWDFIPTINYQSGNPYGDPFEFPDSNQIKGKPTLYGPDPYTGVFDALGSLKGPSFILGNIAISKELQPNTKITALFTNVFTSIHNHGYAWEYPTSRRVIAYSGNSFYSPYVGPLAACGVCGPQAANYIGDDYWAYGPNALVPTPEFSVTISQKLW